MKVQLDRYDQSDYDRGRPGWFILLWWLVQGTVFRFSLHPMYAFRRRVLRAFGMQVGKGAKIRPSAKFTYPWKVSIGEHSWIGDEAVFYSLDQITIGDHCVVSQKTYLCTGSHRIQSAAFDLVTAPIIFEYGSWAAAGAFIHPGVSLGEYAVAAACSNVIKSVPANEIHGGNPARFLKNRFDSVPQTGQEFIKQAEGAGV
ncbi:putative colanic acid biosynthesis acetyltransferase [Marinococcus luteus]|uniref:putative colanic acid biosynthesis acetyltransferase n=1 Tax=Marinococcus luteus TaxID=1122204 RepID=UPI002ACCE1C9|nr:putative colanic acid biosynthesis acetyltransferase [Marinococcus luteus]MDZ5784219.1 putative colanic acid biosynthesis acetyltransferase [Marinococcus luteus]